MNRRQSKLLLFCGLIIGSSQIGIAVTEYEVVILHPSGFTESQATSISDGQQVGYGWGNITGGQTHALLWTGTAESYVDLNPTWANESWAYDVSGGRQVGEARGEATSNQSHAMLWSGSAASYVDLHPLDAYVPWSSARGISDGQQVGIGGGATYRALLWQGTPESYIDLGPPWFNFDWGLNDCSGGQQVGSYGSVYNITGGHAALWNGVPGEFVDLNPSGFKESSASAISDGQQVGYGRGPATEYLSHALLWSGTAENYVDLHPSGFDTSIAYDINRGLQVGHAGVIGGYPHAVVWSGTAENYVDLHNFLPDSYSSSFAMGIDSSGNIVGYAVTSTVGRCHAVMWVKSTQPPEPPEIPVDIKPGSCPNPLNINDKGVLPVAILGTEDFSVFMIDPVSIRLEGIEPVRSSYEDVTTPVADGTDICECTTEGPDGYIDLTLKFNVQEIVSVLGEVKDGDVLELTLTGVLNDEIPIQGKDCIVIISKGKLEK